MTYKWMATATPHVNGTKIFEKCEIESYQVAAARFDDLSPSEKGTFKGREDYIVRSTGIQLTPLNRNYLKLIEEINIRLNSQSQFEALSINYVMDNQTVFDILTSIEDEEYIKSLYKKTKLKVKSGLNTQEASILMECLHQGRSLLEAGRKADILAKPLIDFYAATAFSYALIVMNSPIHKSIESLKGSHGHSYNHLKGTVDFGGDIPSGTFLDLLCAFPVAHVSSGNTSIKYSVLDSVEYVQNNSISISLCTLLSMVPELSNFYRHVDCEHKSAHSLSVDTSVNNSRILYNFYIGDGINKPNKEKLAKCFKLTTDEVIENQGSYKLSIDAEKLQIISPMIYQDIKGNLWYIESPVDGLYLPEICLHFLIISALCNIMRYSPHEWSMLLNNKVTPQFTLLINRYIGLFETKFPILLVNYLTNYSIRIED